jgi:GNAT superfamily N-acetyltransferase
MQMTAADVEVTVLTLADATAYNEFFRQGALAHPDSLRISPADIAAAPFQTGSSERGSTLLARSADGQWQGVVSVERESGREKRRHIAWVLRMYVRAGSSGRGIGRVLLRAAIAKARELPGVAKLNLTVAAHNTRAVALYESEGFRSFAREVDAFRDAESRTELTMALEL